MGKARTRRVSRVGRLLVSDRRVRSGVSLLVLGLLVATALPWTACSTRPPRDADDLCSIFEEKRSWHRSAKQTAEEWGVPEWVQLAIVHQESSFRAHARPPRRKLLWIFPGPRASSAYGYGQVIDPTWDHYRQAVGVEDVSRADFGDVSRFIGWYGDFIHRVTGVDKKDARRLYMAYHEGPTGYRRGSHSSKEWLAHVARRVSARATRYKAQYEGCRERLDRRRFLWFF